MAYPAEDDVIFLDLTNLPVQVENPATMPKVYEGPDGDGSIDAYSQDIDLHRDINHVNSECDLVPTERRASTPDSIIRSHPNESITRVEKFEEKDVLASDRTQSYVILPPAKPLGCADHGSFPYSFIENTIHERCLANIGEYVVTPRRLLEYLEKNLAMKWHKKFSSEPFKLYMQLGLKIKWVKIHCYLHTLMAWWFTLILYFSEIICPLLWLNSFITHFGEINVPPATDCRNEGINGETVEAEKDGGTGTQQLVQNVRKVEEIVAINSNAVVNRNDDDKDSEPGRVEKVVAVCSTSALGDTVSHTAPLGNVFERVDFEGGVARDCQGPRSASDAVSQVDYPRASDLGNQRFIHSWLNDGDDADQLSDLGLICPTDDMEDVTMRISTRSENEEEQRLWFDGMDTKCRIEDFRSIEPYSMHGMEAPQGLYVFHQPDGSTVNVVQEVKDTVWPGQSSKVLAACLTLLSYVQGVEKASLSVGKDLVKGRIKSIHAGTCDTSRLGGCLVMFALLLATLLANCGKFSSWKGDLKQSTVQRIQDVSKLIRKYDGLGLINRKDNDLDLVHSKHPLTGTEKDFFRDVLDIPEYFQPEQPNVVAYPVTMFPQRGYEDEFQRLASFGQRSAENWIPAVPLAENGYHIGSNLAITCHFCKSQFPAWKKEWNPRQKHAPHCPFVSKAEECGNVPMKPSASNGKYQPAVQGAFSELCLGEMENQTKILVRDSQRYNDTFSHPQLPEDQMESLSIANDHDRQESDTLMNTEDQPEPSGSNLSSQSQLKQDKASGLRYFVHTYDERGRPVSTSQKVEFNTTDEKTNASMKREVDRLKTFENIWKKSNVITPAELAKAGFYFAGTGDRVRCAFCNGVLRNWAVGDSAAQEHRRHYPTCPFVLNLDVGNEPFVRDLSNLQQSTPATSRPNPVLDKLASGSVDRPRSAQRNVPSTSGPASSSPIPGTIVIPKHPNFSSVESRMLTYDAWPTTNVQRPRELAVAGFFYTGAADNVRCFHCDGGLRNWLDTDVPWVEHAKWFQRCGFLQGMKGVEFVMEEMRKHDQSGTSTGVVQSRVPTSNAPFTAPTPSSTSNAGVGIVERPQASGVRRVEAREVRARFDTEKVRMILSMGYEEAVVKYVILERLRHTGDDFRNTEEMLEAVLAEAPNLEERGVPFYDEILQREFGKPMSIVYPKVPSGSDKPAATHANPMTQSTSASLEIPDDEKSLAEENRQLKEQTTCKICMDNEVSMVFIPCGHLVACADCAPNLRQCPICRRTITGTIRTFLS